MNLVVTILQGLSYTQNYKLSYYPSYYFWIQLDYLWLLGQLIPKKRQDYKAYQIYRGDLGQGVEFYKDVNERQAYNTDNAPL